MVVVWTRRDGVVVGVGGDGCDGCDGRRTGRRGRCNHLESNKN